MGDGRGCVDVIGGGDVGNGDVINTRGAPNVGVLIPSTL